MVEERQLPPRRTLGDYAMQQGPRHFSNIAIPLRAMVTHNNPFTIMFPLEGQLVVMCPKPKHLKHFLFEVLVGDLGVEVEGLESLGLKVVSFTKLEGKVFEEVLFLSFHDDL